MQQVGLLAFVVLGAFCLVMACCCLCVLNSRLIIIANSIEFEGWAGTLLEIFCCLPRRRDADDERDERLLGAEEGGAEGAEQGEEEESDDPVGKGYLPPGTSSVPCSSSDARRRASQPPHDALARVHALHAECVHRP